MNSGDFVYIDLKTFSLDNKAFISRHVDRVRNKCAKALHRVLLVADLLLVLFSRTNC